MTVKIEALGATTLLGPIIINSTFYYSLKNGSCVYRQLIQLMDA